MEDKLKKRAEQHYERFNQARQNRDVEQGRIAANEALIAIDTVRRDQSAILVGSVEQLGEHGGRLAADEVWLSTAEADIRAYLKVVNES
jgi:hypothetical protein